MATQTKRTFEVATPDDRITIDAVKHDADTNDTLVFFDEHGMVVGAFRQWTYFKVLED